MRKNKKILNDVFFTVQFAIDDFKAKYAGSIAGGAWAFLQPMTTILLYWFVFQLGFKSAPIANFPFILWLMVGLIPWFFITDGISNATPSLVEYSYLVKKVLFNINILPISKLVSTMMVQVVLVIFGIIFYMFFGYYPDIYYLLIPIYLVYMMILLAGIVYITSTLYVFFKDTMQIVSIALQGIFWLTPIVWDFSMMPEFVQKILVFNPLYYVVSGYRNIFVYKNGIGSNWGMTAYYWIVAIGLLILGVKLFKKCKDHFADVL